MSKKAPKIDIKGPTKPEGGGEAVEVSRRDDESQVQPAPVGGSTMERGNPVEAVDTNPFLVDDEDEDEEERELRERLHAQVEEETGETPPKSRRVRSSRTVTREQVQQGEGDRPLDPLEEVYRREQEQRAAYLEAMAREKESRRAHEQQAREQQAREQQAREQQAREQQAHEQEAREQQDREQMARQKHQAQVRENNDTLDYVINDLFQEPPFAKGGLHQWARIHTADVLDLRYVWRGPSQV